MIGQNAVTGYVSRVSHFNPNAYRYLAYSFFLALNTGIYGVIFNLYILRLGYMEDLLGLILAIISISIGLFALPAAIICDRIGRKNTLILSSGLLTLSLILLYTVTVKEVLLMTAMFYGISSAFSAVAGSPFMVENSSRSDRMHLFSMNSALTTTATVIGNLVAGILPGIILLNTGYLADSAIPYRYTLYLSLAAVVMSIIPLLMIKERQRPHTTFRHRLTVVGSAIRSPVVQKLILINSLIGIGAGMIVPFFNVYFQKVLSAKTDEIGLIFSLAQVTMVLGLILLPVLTEKFGKVRMIALTELASIPFLILIAFTGNLYLAAFAYIMRMALMNMANPAISNFNMEMVGESQRATVSSLTTMGWNIFLAISTFISGILMAHSSYVLPYMITCVVYIVAAALYYIFFIKAESEVALMSTVAQ